MEKSANNPNAEEKPSYQDSEYPKDYGKYRRHRATLLFVSGIALTLVDRVLRSSWVGASANATTSYRPKTRCALFTSGNFLTASSTAELFPGTTLIKMQEFILDPS
jgi:hypothetical protein